MSLLEVASGLAVRYLKHEHLLIAREGYFSLRQKMHPVMRAMYGTFDSTMLREHLAQTVGKDFEVLMVHSSVNNMKPMYTGSPLDLVQMLMSFCGPERTLVMPAFYFGDTAEGGAYAAFKKNPRFDIKRTPSMMGLATELFRRTRGVIQSRHPIYRVSAFGPLAAQLTAGHEQAGTALGHGTPFDFMANHKTRVIGIGKPIQVLTQAHSVEHLMGEDFPVPGHAGEPLNMTLLDGKEEIPFTLTSRGLQWRFNIWKLQSIMNRDTLKEWKFHSVPLFATYASVVTEALLEAAKRGVTLYDRPS
jgi:aminoglycoside 3-N-acetyltransferase